MRVLRVFTAGLVGVALKLPAAAAVMASAAMTSTPTPGGPYAYQYNLTLWNSGDLNLQTFWYAWDDSGLNFLKSYPYNITTPSGWYGFPTYDYAYDPASGYTYHYGVEWYGTTPLSPGHSLSGFGFQSDDTPDMLAGISDAIPINPGDAPFPVGTSFAYQNYPAQQAGDVGFQFVVATPEPGATALLAVAAGTMMCRRKHRAATSMF